MVFSIYKRLRIWLHAVAKFSCAMNFNIFYVENKITPDEYFVLLL